MQTTLSLGEGVPRSVPVLEDGSWNAMDSTESLEDLSQGILFVTMLIFLGGTFFMTQRRRIPLPYTVVLFLYGIFVGAATLWIYPDVATALGDIPPELLFYIFLPVLIFEGSYAINIHALRRVIFQVVLLATVGLFINTGLLALPIKLFFKSWSWYTALLLGSLLSATDPVAVVALLKDLGVDKCMTAIVDGESVMNDGTAIILFNLLLPAARLGYLEDSVGMIVLKSIRLSLLPLVVGPFFGFVQSFWLRRTGDGLTKACITVSVTYVSYYIANHLLGTSGVLTLFFQGVFLSYYCPSLFPGREGNQISATWEFLVHLGNTVLFSLVGVILVADVIPTVSARDIVVVVAIYVAMLISRLLMLEALTPVLNCFSYKVSQRHVALLVHAGLRGGVAATLALAVKQEGLREGVEVLKITSGIVLLTLLVNATTASKVVRQLGFRTKEEHRHLNMNLAMQWVRASRDHALEAVKRDTKYRNASWMQVEKYVYRHICNPFRGTDVEAEPDEDRTVNRLLMSAFKAALWRQRDEEVVTETVVIQLTAVLATLIDRGELLDVEQMHWFHRRRGEKIDGDERVIAEQASPQRHLRTQQQRSSSHGGADGGRMPSRLTAEQQRRLGRPRFRSSSSAMDLTGEKQEMTQESTATTASATPAPSTAAARSTASIVSAQSQADKGSRSSSQQPPLPHPYPTAPSPSLERSHEVLPTYCPVQVEVLSPPPGHLDFPESQTGDGTHTTRMVEALMRRLLPTWVTVAERVFFSKGYFVQFHRRAQENAFVSLLTVLKCLTVLSPLKFTYVSTDAQATRVEKWMQTQVSAANRAIRFFYANFPEATNNVASTRAVVSVANSLHEAVDQLRLEQGIGTNTAGVLEEMVAHMRAHVPMQWTNNAEEKEDTLVLRAVSATTLGKGLRSVEVKAISSMGLVRKFREGDTITLPDNAFLIIVFGSVRAMHGQWTTLTQDELMESFGDTVGLEALMLPQEFRVTQQRRWRVISTEATALLISFNSIKPFLMERSFRAVKALWRAAAVEVLLPFLSKLVTVPETQVRTKRERLMELILAGTPLIGPRDCDLARCETQFYLYFYLRGSDQSGLFSSHTPPCHIATFYVHQLRWTAPDAVLYAVPMSVGDRGYVPSDTVNSGPTAITGAANGSANSNASSSEDEEAVPLTMASSSATAAAEGHGFSTGQEKPESVSTAKRQDRVGGDAGRTRPVSHLESVTSGVHRSPAPVSVHLQRESEELLPGSGEPVDTVHGAGTGTAAAGVPSVASWARNPELERVMTPPALAQTAVHTAPHVTGDAADHAGLSFTSSVLDRDNVTPPVLSHGESTTTTRTGATSIINNVLLGTIPEDPADSLHNANNISAFASALGAFTSPAVSHRELELFPISPCLSELPSHGGGMAASAIQFYPESDDISIFYTLEKFVTQVPFINQTFVHYASALEQLCIATLRYLRFPADRLHVQHAEATGEQTVEYLLHFCVELSILKRTCRVVSKRYHVDSYVLNPFDVKNDIDSAFQAAVCTWARHFQVSGKFHLREMVTEMNVYANRRFPDYVALLQTMVELEPALRTMETTEGMNRLCRQIVGKANAGEEGMVEMDHLEDAA